MRLAAPAPARYPLEMERARILKEEQAMNQHADLPDRILEVALILAERGGWDAT